MRVSFRSVAPIFGATYARLGGISGEYGLKLGAFSGKKFQGVSNWDGKLSRHLAVRIGSRQGKPCNERIRIWNRSERKSNSLRLRVKGNPHSVSTRLLDLIANKCVSRRGVFLFLFRGSCRLEPCFDGESLLRLCSPQAVSMRVSSKPALKLRYMSPKVSKTDRHLWRGESG